MTNKKKFDIEYPINVSPKVLYARLSTASGLAEWFADDVNLKGTKFTFIWEGFGEDAEMVQRRDNRIVRFKWLDDEEDDSYFEFRIVQDDITGDVSLVVTDFAEEDEIDDSIGLWDQHIHQLRTLLGSTGS